MSGDKMRQLTDSELMYQKRSATGSEEFAVQLSSTISPGE
jgi:hypothetical protein